jgi:hypothetical protein
MINRRLLILGNGWETVDMKNRCPFLLNYVWKADKTVAAILLIIFFSNNKKNYSQYISNQIETKIRVEQREKVHNPLYPNS